MYFACFVLQHDENLKQKSKYIYIWEATNNQNLLKTPCHQLR